MIRWFRPRRGVLAVRPFATMPARPPPSLRRPRPLRAAWLPDESLHVGAGTDYPFGLALSSDGRQLVFPAAQAGAVTLWLQSLSTNETRALPSTEGRRAVLVAGRHAHRLFRGRALRAIDLEAGTVTDLAEAPSGRGAAWNAAGDLVFAATGADGGLVRRAPDGAIAQFTTPDRRRRVVSSLAGVPARRPHVVFRARDERSRAGIWIASLDNPSDATAPHRRRRPGDRLGQYAAVSERPGVDGAAARSRKLGDGGRAKLAD